MCAEYKVRTKKSIVEEQLGIKIQSVAKTDEWDARIKLSALAPVIGFKDDEVRLNELVFPIVPFPNSRLSQLQSNRTGEQVPQTEEKIVRIYELPTWKEGFEKFPCVVPMSSFLEPAYWGQDRGKVIEFELGNDELLFVPSILIRPKKPPTQKLNGFSLLTHFASDQMLKYHHRLLVFLRPAEALAYLKLGKVPAQERFQFLLENRYIPKFKTTVDRTMAKGWEKRVEQHEFALADESKYSEALERESVAG